MARFTDKQRLFVEHYLQCWNATEAARRAGYRHPRQMGSENLSKPVIREVIQQRLDTMAMDADEVLAHLASIARGSAADIIRTDAGPQGMIDLAKAEERGALHLVKKLEWTKGSVRVEFYDRLEALELLGKAHRLFVSRSEHSGPGGGPIPVKHEYTDLSELSDEELAQLAELARRLRGDPAGEAEAELQPVA